MNHHYLYLGGYQALTRYCGVLPEKLAPALISSDMDENVMIYGGNERLVETLRQALSAGPPALFLVTACPPGLIGDELDRAIARAQQASPQTRVIPLEVDGNMSGGFNEGWLDTCQRAAAKLIDPFRKPIDNAVNPIGESAHGRSELNYR